VRLLQPLRCQEERPVLKTLEDVSEILGVDVKSLPDSALIEKERLVDWTNRLIARNGEEWVRRHRRLLVDQWKYIADF